MNALKGSRLFLCLFSCAVLSSWAFAQTGAKQSDAQALQQQLDSLKAQIADLEDKIRNLTPTGDGSGAQQAKSGNAQQGPKTSEAAKELKTEQTESKATADYKMFSEDEEAAARYDNVPLDPRYPNYFRLPGTRTFMRIGGYAKSDLTFDPRPAGDQEQFIPASIPIPAPANVSNSTVSVRPSRINVDFLVPIEKERTLKFFFEMDFFGSSSTTPRLRHVYAQGRNLLIGQTFSNFEDVDAGPDTLDFAGPNSWVSLRNPQVRYTRRFGKSTTGSISVEKPSSDVAFKTADFNAQPNSPSPDGTVRLRREMSFGHVQFAGLFRDISAFLPDGRSDSVFGWGFNLTGLVKVIGKDAFVYQGAYGNGISRYISDTSGLGIDVAVISAQKPHLEAVPAIATYGGYQHFWTANLRSSAVYGFLQTENTAAQASSTFHRSEYSAVNLIWTPIASLSFGSEFLYGWRVNKDNSTGNAPRIQLSAKYNFMQMKGSQ